jgi:cysteine desulfurase/selenocysteine lyase
MQLYFDNAATSYPKPDIVLDAMVQYQEYCGASPGRGAYSQAVEATNLLDACRRQLCQIVHAPSTNHCVFTANCTDALNLAINGIAQHFLSKNSPVHIVTTVMDHNSVLRPIHELSKQGVTCTIVEADSITGIVNPEAIKQAITSQTRLVVVAHGSNVTGTIQDIKTIGAMCGTIPFLVDAAQTMGHIPIDLQEMNIDLLAFPGHKGLLGPLGIGGLILMPGMEDLLSPTRTGGTGSESEYPIQPSSMPDKYESGSHNMIGIAGLVASTKWILSTGIDCLLEKEQKLTCQFINALKEIEGVRIAGPQTTENRCAVFSLVFETCPHAISKNLESAFGISSRIGLHCAPFAHQTVGTDVLGGTVRVSFGPYHTAEDISHLINAIAHCTQQCLV